MEVVDLAGSDQWESEKLLCPFWDILPGYYRGGDGLQWLLQSDNIQHSIYLYSTEGDMDVLTQNTHRYILRPAFLENVLAGDVGVVKRILREED